MENTIGTAFGNFLGTTIKTLGLVDVFVGLRDGAAVPPSDAEVERAKAADTSQMLNGLVKEAMPSVMPLIQRWISERFLGGAPQGTAEGQRGEGDANGLSHVVLAFAGEGAISASYEGTPFMVNGAKSVHEALRGLAALLEDDFNKTMAGVDAANAAAKAAADAAPGKN